MTDLPIASFAVWCAVCVVQREDHLFHVEGIPPPIWQPTPYEWAGKRTDSRDLACQGIALFPPDSSLLRLGLGDNIAEASRLLLPLLDI